ncbi:hypothetical protein CIB93_17815 [Streptomyces sp. WZ.A104]|uniref:hypothetical protein n=1 Tax=Streptomyces sp. WZ.A104 TaxID=2023771 RepID=UPI000BBCB6D0|nr:hypothetical protein [Streptomyces sp. WZ.A104]PCG84700.1 hypothetical protein CIB93_17815 [Streptomyces sp. WZ.A104]
MTAYPIKQLPFAALPEGGAATWSAADAERWRKARVPAALAPVLGGWLLAALVAVSYVLLFAISSAGAGWHGGSGEGDGTDWLRYPGAVLLTALPLWYRYVPVAAVTAALAVAVEAGLSLALSGGLDTPAVAGYTVVLAACALAFTGGCLRLRARRRQRALTLAAAGTRRFPLPKGVPESDGYRGHQAFLGGLALCLLAAVFLAEGLFGDLTASGAAPAYDAVGQQRIGLVLLVAGTTLYGRGHLAYRAARRLHEEPQPALIVGVRAGEPRRLGASQHPWEGVRYWVYADARTTSAPPLIAYESLPRDTRAMTRLLGSGSVYGAGNGHHDVDPHHEPFEAVLYGTLAEGDEVALEYACAEYHRHQQMGRMYATTLAAPLRPDRRHGLGPWEPVDGPARQQQRLQEAAEAEERRRKQAREAEERRRNPRRSSPPSRGGTRDGRSGRADGGGCGGSGPSCGSSCGGGGGGCGGD